MEGGVLGEYRNVYIGGGVWRPTLHGKAFLLQVNVALRESSHGFCAIFSCRLYQLFLIFLYSQCMRLWMHYHVFLRNVRDVLYSTEIEDMWMTRSSRPTWHDHLSTNSDMITNMDKHNS